MSKIDINGKKNFWQRPEGTPGALMLIAIVGGLGYFLMKAMPQLIELAENIWYLGAMLGGLFVVGYMLLDKRVRTLMWYFYKSIIRKTTGIFIQLDPIAIIEGYLEDLKDKMKSMEKQIGSLKGQIRKIKSKIADKEEKVEYFMNMAKSSQNKGMNGQMNLNLKKAEREKDAAKKFGILRDKTEKLYLVLDKMKKYSAIMVDDISHEVEIKKEEREIIRTSHSVMKSAVNIINGNSDRKVIFDQAMEYIVDDIGMRIGEMERFMDVSSDFMVNMDLENAMYEEKGLKALDEWSAKVDEKFHPNNYESPMKQLEDVTINFKDKEKKKVVQKTSFNSFGSEKKSKKKKYF